MRVTGENNFKKSQWLRGCFIAFLAFLTLSTPTLAATVSEQVAAAYRRGSAMLEPYLILTDRKSKDPKTISGRAEVLEGIRLLRLVTEADPQHWPSFWQIRKAYQALADHQSAYVVLKQAHEIIPSQPNVAREYMIECICVGKTGDAVQVAEGATAIASTDAGLAANLGLALLADGQLSRAQAVVERALDLVPTDSITRALLAEIIAVRRGRKPANYCPQ